MTLVANETEQPLESLSEFLDYNRPVVMDIYTILSAVIDKLNTYNEPNNLIFHIEHIYYNRGKGTVCFTMCNGYQQNATMQIHKLLMQLESAVKYAGNETNSFVREFHALYGSDGGLEKCTAMLKKYEQEIKSMDNRCSIFNTIFIVIMVAIEILLCVVLDIKFYS